MLARPIYRSARSLPRKLISSTPFRGIANATIYPGLPSPDLTESEQSVREAVSKICLQFPDEYWSAKDQEKKFPHEFATAFADAGWLGICLPEKYGGSALGISEAAVMMQAVTESGAGIAGASTLHMQVSTYLKWSVIV